MDKRYAEALERAKAAINDCGDNLGRKKMIYGIFPELQESGDERIRKFLAKIIDNLEPKDFDSVKKMDVIAWLEKQKEQKPAEWSEEEVAIIDGIIHDVRNMKMRAQEDVDYPASREELDAYDEELDFLNRLKSRRPQYHWKPSEEQLMR